MRRSTFAVGAAAALVTPLPTWAKSSNSVRMLVLGDSVTWGQGLDLEFKMHSLLARWMGISSLPPGLVFLAHSGGTIGIDEFDVVNAISAPNIPGEIPDDNPTIFQQCSTDAAAGPFDFIIVCGGINDVDIRTLFNPSVSQGDLENLIDVHCYHHIRALLDRLRVQYVNGVNNSCRIFVLGYYPVLGLYPSFKTLNIVLRLLGIPTNGFASSGARLNEDYIQYTLLANSRIFAARSMSRIRRAVAEANFVDPPCFVAIDPGISENHSAFSEDPWIWDVTPQGVPKDDQFGFRHRWCTENEKGLDIRVCELASLGHPNRFGALAYAKAIWREIGAGIVGT